MTHESYGTFWNPATPDSKIAGHLVFPDFGQARLSIIDGSPSALAPDSDAPPRMIGGTYRIPLIHGQLADAPAVNLIDASWAGTTIGRSLGTQRLRIRIVLSGALLLSSDEEKLDRNSTRLNSSHTDISRMPSSA